MAAPIVKSYVYKIYQNTTFLGNLQNVTSEFGYSQQINSAGAQLTIEIGNTFDDVGAEQVDTFWVDEAGNHITDEAGNRLVFAKTLNFTDIPIDLGNRIKVFMFNDANPNGTIVFDGLISKWQTSYTKNTVTLTVLSFGVQLANYIVTAETAGTAVDQEVQDILYNFTVDKDRTDQFAQSFNLATPQLVGGFSVYTYYGAASAVYNPLIWELYSGTPNTPGALLDSGNITGNVGAASAGMVPAYFTTPLTLATGDYFILFTTYVGGGGTGNPLIGATATNPYAGGSLFYRNLKAGTTWADQGRDLTISVNISTGSALVNFASIDPGQIARTFITQVFAQGGMPDYTDSTIELTNTSTSYDFKIASGLEGMQKALALAPDGWYWYYDLTTNLVHFHQIASTASHTFILGKHFVDADITYSLETVINSVYFSGGDTGSGNNLFSVYTSAPSISSYGKWTELLSDNRVTLQSTADTLGNNELNAKQTPLFQIRIEIVDGNYDIETIVLGQMVQFRNFNNLLDTVFYQVSQIERHPNSVILSLGNLPPRASSELQEAKNRLAALETVNNSDIPT